MLEFPYSLLIVDDEPALQQLIQRYFSRRGGNVLCAGTGAEMRTILQQQPVDLVLLDVNLPDTDGFNLLQEVKRDYTCGVIMLTIQNELDDRLHGLNAGADDFVPKPFEMSELLARANAVLRRLQTTHQKFVPDSSQYCFAGYTLNYGTRELQDKNGNKINLSPAELDLLYLFLRHPQTVLSRDYLLQQTRGREATPYDRTIDVRVGQLRRKLPNTVENESESLFRTIRGGGYMLTIEVIKSG